MRHLGSIVLAIVFAALTYVLAGVGQVKFALGTATASTDWNAVGVGIGALVIAGAIYAILVMTPISPLGPLVAAALFIGAELWAVSDRSGLQKLIGHSVLGVHGAQSAPLSGLALFAAVPLLATVLSPSRWRGASERDGSAESSESAAPVYPTPSSAAPIYTPTQTTPETAADSTTDSRPDNSANAGSGGDSGEDSSDK
jgi:hypothetical protein